MFHILVTGLRYSCNQQTVSFEALLLIVSDRFLVDNSNLLTEQMKLYIYERLFY